MTPHHQPVFVVDCRQLMSSIPFMECALVRAPTAQTLILLATAFIGCGPSGTDSAVPDLPTESEPPVSGGVDSDFEFPTDTEGVAPDGRDPDHWLFLYHFGALDLSEGDALSGELTIYEFIDWELPDPHDEGEEGSEEPIDPDLEPWELLEESPLHCEAHFTLSGEPSEHLCDGCAEAYDITFTLVSGDLRPCFDPHLPADGDVRRFGWSLTEGIVHYDVADLGVWTPWYWLVDDPELGLLLSWQDSKGISLEDQEER